jgi:DNA-binding transcriptional ArsR family regulator
MTAERRSSDNDLLIALRHPLRRQILRAMADGEAVSPRELAAAVEKPLSNVSYHVRVLASCSAVTLAETKPAHGSVQHFYRFAVDAPWARQILGLGEFEGGPAGDNSGGAPT